MRIITSLLLSCAFAAPAAAQNPYVATGAKLNAIADQRARNVGDILTIVIQETTQVRNEERVERRNDTSLAARLEAYSLSNSHVQRDNILPRIDIRKESGLQRARLVRTRRTPTCAQASPLWCSTCSPTATSSIAGTRSRPASTTRPAR